MAEVETIRSFLVRLGFVSDEAALRKFEQGIAKASTAVMSFGAALTGLVVGSAIAVDKIASRLETLYFASARSGASVSGIKAMSLATQNLGASAGDALAGIESLAKFMRNSPAGESFVAQWAKTRDANGNMLDTGDILAQLGQHFQQEPQWQAAIQGGMLGLSDNLILALRNPAFTAELARVRGELKGSFFDDASQGAHQFKVDIRDLGLQLEKFGVQVEDSLQRKFGVSVKSITAWLENNGPMLAERVTHIAGAILDDFNKVFVWLENHGPQIAHFISEAFDQLDASYRLIRPALEWVFDSFVRLDGVTDGWSTKLLVLAATLKLIGATSIIGGVLNLAAAFLGLGAGMAGVAGGGVAAAAGGAGLAVAGGVGLGYLFDKLAPNNWLAQFGNYIGGSLYDAKHQRGDIIERLTHYGWSREQAIGIATNLNAESQFRPDAVGDNGHAYGIAQWHKPFQDAFATWAGHPMQGSSLDEQLAYLDHDLRHGSATGVGRAIQNSQNAGDVAAMFSRMYERPAAGDAAADARAKAAMNFSQETNINIVGDANTARDVERAQKRVNADLMRLYAGQGN